MLASDFTLSPGDMIEFVSPPIGLRVGEPYEIESDNGLLYVTDWGGMKRYVTEWASRSKFRLLNRAG